MANAVVIAASLAMVAVIGLALLWRRAEQRAEAASERCATLEAERVELEARLGREEKARRRQAEELASHRKKADKARRRESKSVAPPLGTASRIHDLEEAVARAERERDRVVAEKEALGKSLEQLRLRLELASEAAAPPAPASEPVTAGVQAESEATRREAELSSARERLEQLRGELVEARAGQARMRKRIARQEELYAALRGELEVKKDRLRAQTEQLERLQALKVSLVD